MPSSTKTLQARFRRGGELGNASCAARVHVLDAKSLRAAHFTIPPSTRAPTIPRTSNDADLARDALQYFADEQARHQLAVGVRGVLGVALGAASSVGARSLAGHVGRQRADAAAQRVGGVHRAGGVAPPPSTARRRRRRRRGRSADLLSSTADALINASLTNASLPNAGAGGGRAFVEPRDDGAVDVQGRQARAPVAAEPVAATTAAAATATGANATAAGGNARRRPRRVRRAAPRRRPPAAPPPPLRLRQPRRRRCRRQHTRRRQSPGPPGASAGTAAPKPTGPPSTKAPNIVLMVADDAEPSDLGVYRGGPWAFTPNLDGIARKGAMFLKAHSAAPLCSPSRFTMLTGLHASCANARVPTAATVAAEARRRLRGVDSEMSHLLPPADPKKKGWQRLAHRTLAHRLGAAGYVTGAFGLWHLGIPEPDASKKELKRVKETPPEKWVVAGGGKVKKTVLGEYEALQAHVKAVGGFSVAERLYAAPLDTDSVVLPSAMKVHNVEWVADGAAQFIQRHGDEKSPPFFLYVGWTLPHGPDAGYAFREAAATYTEWHVEARRGDGDGDQ